MLKQIGWDDVEPLALGSAFLGTGGGGDPYIGALLCKETIAKHGPVAVVGVEALADDAALFVAAGMGAPTVMMEKLFSVDDAHRAVSALEKRLGRTATAIIAAEIGGVNSMMPIAYAAARGLPVVDGDGMGRAFPSLDMVTYNLAGVSCTPMSIADEHGNFAVIEANSAKIAEDLARPLAAAMGASVSISCYAMTGKQAREAAIPNTLSAAWSIGRVLEKSGEGEPVDRLVESLRASRYYSRAYRILDGKIVELQRETSRGWVFGRCTIAELHGSSVAEIQFQNENLCVRVDGRLRTIVPDLVAIVDRETGHAIPTERLRYGQRVAVIGCSSAPQLRTQAALQLMGPSAFGLEDEFQPIEALMGEKTAAAAE